MFDLDKEKLLILVTLCYDVLFLLWALLHGISRKMLNFSYYQDYVSAVPYHFIH